MAITDLKRDRQDSAMKVLTNYREYPALKQLYPSGNLYIKMKLYEIV
ncbi:hypothetical protein DFO77_11547 [Marinilabilia salmonicolor]|jgi:hypothetical protein|uniref:Uncharacterized protein n=1 Tax=Marinilabilia salmonicolor TaxID=989 RepID=A0A2T0XFS9_9BACT|nr:hypothetical protein BY457_11184 [Marinilabilia salmonicolor]RCW32502.1 hypothetical protein DFO77_11547 [Marinilabilia salmonicolor]